MKVLVTGGCGFLGSHISEYYLNQGDEVVILDNMTKYELTRTGYNIRKTRNYNYHYLVERGANIIKGDISNIIDVNYTTQDCDYIIHTAAQPSMTIAIEQPILDFTTNVVGTFNLLNAARIRDIPIVNCSTVHVYGNTINENLKELETRFVREPSTISELDKIMNGTVTPLHASKLSAEFYVNSYIDTYGLRASNFRLSGMYGERQFGGEDHGWIANFIIRTLLGLPIKIYGTDKQVRDVLYASDAVGAFDSFYKYQVSGTYNVGGGEKNIISIKECLDLIRDKTTLKQSTTVESKRLGDLWYFVSDILKIKQNLKWEPKVLPHDGISKSIKWLSNNKELFI